MIRDIRELLIRNTPRKIEASQADVLHIYVDASFDYSDYSGLGQKYINIPSEKYIYIYMYIYICVYMRIYIAM